MKMKRGIALTLLLCLVLTMAGCGSEGAVYVQSVEALAAFGGIAPGDRFPGIVVSENVTEITRDSEKTIAELLVRAGDDVTEGQVLFAYDTDALKLTLEKQRLELEQLNATIENHYSRITTLEQERNRASANNKLQYTIEIQSAELDLKEAQMNLKTKEAEVLASETLLENAEVVSPVSGRVQSVSESGTDNFGNPLPYITIQQSGSYRIKGVLGELQRGGLVEGDRLKVFSRTDAQQIWSGTVTLVDYESPYQGSDMDRYYGMPADEMGSSSKYPFYVELEDYTGLILGQHIYMELEAEEAETSGVRISSAFFCYEEDGSVYVWAEKRGRLEKRPVTLGEYNPMQDTYEVTEGLSGEDYIAFPDPELCREGASTTRDQVIRETEGEAA